MSRYRIGHILGAFPVRFYQTESRDGQVTRACGSRTGCALRIGSTARRNRSQ